MAASALGTSSETDASYWLWFVGAGPTANTVALPTSVEPIVRVPDGRSLAGLGNGDDLDAVTGDQGHRRHLVALHQHADDLFTGGQLRRGREHLADHDLAGVDGGVELLADQGGRSGGRHRRDVPRGRDGGGGEVAGSEHGAGGEALGGHDDRTRLAEDWKTAPATAAHTRTRATPRPICQGRRW